jgi:hypothetical protein
VSDDDAAERQQHQEHQEQQRGQRTPEQKQGTENDPTPPDDDR